MNIGEFQPREEREVRFVVVVEGVDIGLSESVRLAQSKALLSAQSFPLVVAESRLATLQKDLPSLDAGPAL